MTRADEENLIKYFAFHSHKQKSCHIPAQIHEFHNYFQANINSNQEAAGLWAPRLE